MTKWFRRDSIRGAFSGKVRDAVGSSLLGKSPDIHLEYLVVLVVLVGIFQLIFGLLKLGLLTDYISNAVMTGFITGVAAQVILGQTRRYNLDW